MLKDEHLPSSHSSHHQHTNNYPPWTSMGGQYSPHTQSPATEYPSYSFSMPPHSVGMPLEPSLQHSMPPMYSSTHAPPPQPLYSTQWPSMLTNPSPPPAHISSSHVHQVESFSTPPALPRLTTQHNGTSRRTLTDQDRRRMCQYHEDHPTVKQTEIGAMFGVERSTVSKVLRHKDKYLNREDGTQSPVKKAKGKFPDIERALANWARNHQKSGLPLTDNIIRDKARFFASTVGSTDCTAKVNSATWLEKFKQKNHLMGNKARKGSDASDIAYDNAHSSGNGTPNGLSPISPAGYIPSTLSHAQSSEKLKSDSSPDSYADFSGLYKHSQAQSATSLASGYTDATAPSSFSPQSPSSPFFIPEMSKMNPLATHTPVSTESVFPPVSADVYNPPVILPITGLHSPGLRNGTMISCEVPQSSASTVHSSNQNSPSTLFAISNGLSGPTPSQDDARKALEVVMDFFQHQPTGIVDAQEFITMSRIMEKLKMQGSVGELPGGMHTIDLIQSQKEMSRKRSVQGLM